MTTTLVTGANRGIGREVAIQLAALGHHVLVGSRTATNATDTAETITAAGGRATIVELDIADPESVTAAATEIEELGGLDVLVNNAGIAGPTAGVDAIDPDDWDRTIAVNLNGMFYCCLLYTSPSPRVGLLSRMPSSA